MTPHPHLQQHTHGAEGDGYPGARWVTVCGFPLQDWREVKPRLEEKCADRIVSTRTVSGSAVMHIQFSTESSARTCLDLGKRYYDFIGDGFYFCAFEYSPERDAELQKVLQPRFSVAHSKGPRESPQTGAPTAGAKGGAGGLHEETGAVGARGAEVGHLKEGLFTLSNAAQLMFRSLPDVPEGGAAAGRSTDSTSGSSLLLWLYKQVFGSLEL
uniref:RRM domain-containing protein n=1 Tax=Chromera velia CCMP2878 TaxID=1169474 RepID=A0A0G4FKH1_9ALVE|eukprot:Cvel_418.t1-p1 / transcript=Cvel_418.t1 / gene=Cvel_418 / organism=Chromera_velia_CCMP2878 / gene_product=hypothetical protein / transcript_product=hypothetical protein / location=Cvel_scaffold13:168998-174748(+) / protein_length=212 / sequence_SO=supercontig / SO=protein_coding / is_pseudo=false